MSAFAFSDALMQRCGVPPVDVIAPLSKLVGCLVGAIPMLPVSLNTAVIALDGKDGCDGIDGFDGVDGHDGYDGWQGTDGSPGEPGEPGPPGQDGTDGMDGTDGWDGWDGVDGHNGTDGMDGIDGTDGLDGCDGLNGVDGLDGIDGEDGKPGCDGIDGQDGQDGQDGMDGDIPYDRFILNGCAESEYGDGASSIRVIPDCDFSNEIITVTVPYPGDFKKIPPYWPIRYYAARQGAYIMLDMPCPPKKTSD